MSTRRRVAPFTIGLASGKLASGDDPQQTPSDRETSPEGA